MGTRVLKLNKIKFFIHPSFIILFLWFIIFLSFYDFLLFVSVVLSHEFGHYIVAKKLGYKLDSFFIAPFGVNLNYKDNCFESKDEIKIALAGPLINLILSIITICLWWIFPVTYNYLNHFVFESIILCLFNLLPCYPLDGGRIFVGLMSEHFSRKKAVKIVCILNYIFSAIFFIIFFITSFINFNPTICLFAVFLLLGSLDSKFESKYQNILVNRKIKNYSKTLFLTVKDDVSLYNLLKHIEYNKHTIFVITTKKKSLLIDEEEIKKLVIKYPLNVKIREIIQQEKE